jgi:dihydroneopterin aldolase/2-amino-4-hydroxy-6-hydroxymethyldihydropteridine diphosphokinase
MARAFISIGSNIHPQTNVRDAILRLGSAVQVRAISTVYRTEPVGPPGQPPFYNCIVEIVTDLEPRELKLQLLRRIENELGRKRGSDKFVARTIDLDLILYEDLVMATQDLTLPDPDILRRPFLAVALHELAPELVLPGSSVRIGEAVSPQPRKDMTPLEDYSARIRKEVLHG